MVENNRKTSSSSADRLKIPSGVGTFLAPSASAETRGGPKAPRGIADMGAAFSPAPGIGAAPKCTYTLMYSKGDAPNEYSRIENAAAMWTFELRGAAGTVNRGSVWPVPIKVQRVTARKSPKTPLEPSISYVADLLGRAIHSPLTYCGDFPGTAGATFHWYHESKPSDGGTPYYWALEAGSSRFVTDKAGTIIARNLSTVRYNLDGKGSTTELGIAAKS